MRPSTLGGRRIARLATAVLLVLSAVPAGAVAAAEELPVLLAESLPGRGWMSFAIHTDGAEVNVAATAVGKTFPAHVGAFLYDDQRRTIIGVMQSTTQGNTGVYVDAHPVPGAVDAYLDEREPRLGGGTFGAGVGLNPGGSGSYKGVVYLLVWAARDLERFDVRISAGEGATLLRGRDGEVLAERGDDAFYFTTEDFSGAANVQAGGTVPVEQAPFRTAVRATALTTLPLDITDTFIGVYGVGFASPVPGAPAGFPLQVNADMSVDGPGGHRACQCVWSSFVPDAFGPPGGPGRYTFNNSGVGTVGGAGDVFVGGADARLPTIPAP